jgi:hypothetical protein
MSLQQLRNVNFGMSYSNLTGSLGVGYTLLDFSGVTSTPRTFSGVYQLLSGSGLYAAYISFSDDFRGQILWDTGTILSSTIYATEQYNYEENNPKIDNIYTSINTITSSIQFLVDAEGGRWKIVSNQMIFYRSDNTTEIMRFNLFDGAGSPSSDEVFERVRV